MPRKNASQLTELLVHSDHLRMPWVDKGCDARRQYLNVDPTGNTGAPGIKANLFQASMRNMRAMLKPREIDVKVLAGDETAQAGRLIMQALLNHQARQSRLARETSKALQYWLLDGHGYLQVSWGNPMTPQAAPGGADADADTATWQRKAGQGYVGDPDKVLQTLLRQNPRYLKGSDHPIVLARDGVDVLVDPDVTDILDARWYAIRSWEPKAFLEERQNSGEFLRSVDLSGWHRDILPSGKARWGADQWTTNQQAHQRPRSTMYGGLARPNQMGRGVEKWELWEFHDRVEGRIYRHVPGLRKILFDEEMDFVPERPTIVDLKSDFNPTSYWVPPDNQQYIDLQKELDQVVNYIRDYVRRHGKQIILVQRGTTPEEIAQIQRAQTAEIVEVADVKAYVPFTMGQLPGEFMNLTQFYMNFMSISSGVTPVAQGIPTSASASATEIANMARALSVRMDDIRIEIDRELLSETLGLFVEFNQRFLPQSHVIELFGEAARLFGQEALNVMGGPQAVQGKYRVEIAVGAAGELKQNVERQLNLSWYSLLAKSPHSNTRAMDEEIHRMFGKNPDRFMQPEEQPDLSLQEADAMEQLMGGAGGGAVQGEGRSLTERGGVQGVSADRGRVGEPSEAAQLSQFGRDGLGA